MDPVHTTYLKRNPQLDLDLIIIDTNQLIYKTRIIKDPVQTLMTVKDILNLLTKEKVLLQAKRLIRKLYQLIKIYRDLGRMRFHKIYLNHYKEDTWVEESLKRRNKTNKTASENTIPNSAPQLEMVQNTASQTTQNHGTNLSKTKPLVQLIINSVKNVQSKATQWENPNVSNN